MVETIKHKLHGMKDIESKMPKKMALKNTKTMKFKEKEISASIKEVHEGFKSDH